MYVYVAICFKGAYIYVYTRRCMCIYVYICMYPYAHIYLVMYVWVCVKSSFTKRVKRQSKNRGFNGNAMLGGHVLEKRSS